MTRVDEPIDYVLVRQPTRQELNDLDQAVQAHREALQRVLTVFEVVANHHPSRLPTSQIWHVLWHFGEPGGVEPGGFVRALLAAIGKADGEQRARLRRAYGTYVDLVDIVEYLRDGLQRLQALVGVEYPCGCQARYLVKHGEHRPECGDRS